MREGKGAAMEQMRQRSLVAGLLATSTVNVTPESVGIYCVRVLRTLYRGFPPSLYFLSQNSSQAFEPSPVRAVRGGVSVRERM